MFCLPVSLTMAPAQLNSRTTQLDNVATHMQYYLNF